MSFQELATIVEHEIPVKILIINNGYLGMVRQWQEQFYARNYSYSDINVAPDFVKLAEAFGMRALRAATDVVRAAGDTTMVANCLAALALIAFEAGDVKESLRHVAACRVARMEHGDRFGLVTTVELYAGLAALSSRVEEAVTLAAAAEAWAIVDGRLYLNYSKKVQAKWLEDVPGNIARADVNWPKLRRAE